MSKVIELKGEDIVNAYDGYKLSRNFGYSCANFNCKYQMKVDMDIFQIYIDNIDNISCFVYINNNGLIEGRRMFFKGKQMLDHNVFPIITKLDEEIYYLYGFYGNNKGVADDKIIDYILNKYEDVIYMDHGHFNNGQYSHKREYWIMKIENMNYSEFPAIDYIYASADLSSFSNFNPSIKIREWLSETYDKEEVSFGSAYHYKPNGGDDDFFLKHWNQQYYKNDEDEDEDDVQEEEIQEDEYSTYYDDESQEEEIQESVKKFGSKCPKCGKTTYGKCDC